MAKENSEKEREIEKLKGEIHNIQEIMSTLQTKEQEMSNCQESEISRSQVIIEKQNAKIGNLIIENDSLQSDVSEKIKAIEQLTQ